MINFNTLNTLFNLRNKTVGELSGELYSIYRPNYSVQDNYPTLVASNLRYRIGVSKAKSFEDPYVIGVVPYDIFGNRTILQPGDLLISGAINNPNITRSAVTIAHIHSQRALEGFRTASRCHIVNSYNEDTGLYDYVHKNVYFDFIGDNRPYGELVNTYSKSGDSVPMQKAVIFNRGLVNQEGMQLIETDYAGAPNGNKWLIDQITYYGPFLVLHLKANWRR